MKYRLKYGLNNARAFSILIFILSKDSFSLDPHLNLTFFFIISCLGFTVSTKLGMNHLTKLILPRNDCMAFLFWGGGVFVIYLFLSGSIFIPCLETMKPSSFPSSKTKKKILRIERDAISSASIKYFLKISYMIFSIPWKYGNIINIHHNTIYN